MVRTAMATQINNQLHCDEPIWPYTKDGKYTVKTGYHLAYNDMSGHHRSSTSTSQNGRGLWTLIWNAGVQPKIKHFMWRLIANALPRRQNLLKK